jgi:nitrogen regulatory protein PII-like uncharacterized protein
MSDELIERWKHILMCSDPDDYYDLVLKVDIEQAITALQERQFQIASLETVVNVKKQRIEELEEALAEIMKLCKGIHQNAYHIARKARAKNE